MNISGVFDMSKHATTEDVEFINDNSIPKEQRIKRALEIVRASLEHIDNGEDVPFYYPEKD